MQLPVFQSKHGVNFVVSKLVPSNLASNFSVQVLPPGAASGGTGPAFAQPAEDVIAAMTKTDNHQAQSPHGHSPSTGAQVMGLTRSRPAAGNRLCSKVCHGVR